MENKVIKILLLYSYGDSKFLCDLWNKLGDGNYSYTKNNLTIQIVWEKPYDYILVVNFPPYFYEEELSNKFEKIIYLVMEPFVKENQWNYKNHDKFKAVWDHSFTSYNNNEWHLNLSLPELKNIKIEKKYDKEISAILSSKYSNEGHKIRINFIYNAQYEKNLVWHIYGDNSFNRWEEQNYKGSLPSHNKKDGLFPYKYTFNMENGSIPGYYTEKLIDAILSECLCFYSGPPNISLLINPKAYVELDFTDYENSTSVIKKALSEDWYSQRLPYILEAKKIILNETGFFPRLHKIFQKIYDNKMEVQLNKIIDDFIKKYKKSGLDEKHIILKNIKNKNPVILSKEKCNGSVASIIFYLRFHFDCENYGFNGNAGGIRSPGGGALFGDLYINDESIFSDTVSFQFNATPVYLAILFFNSSSKLLGHAQFGSVSTVSGIGGGSGSWYKK